MRLDSSISQVKGIGAKTEELFQSIGVYSLRDMLLYFPRTYLIYPPIGNFESLEEGKTLAILGKLRKPFSVRSTRSGNIELATVWFGEYSIDIMLFNQAYINKNISPGAPYVFYGKLTKKGQRFSMNAPEIYSPSKYEEMVALPQPVYSLTKGLSNNTIKKAVGEILKEMGDYPDYIPSKIRDCHELMSLEWAIRQMHQPASMDHLIRARRRLVYGEFFWFSLRMGLENSKETAKPNPLNLPKDAMMQHCISSLPFSLTEGQKACLEDIVRDLRGPVLSQRLIQGDVGSGKTIVAFLAMTLCLENGYSAAIMAPTEVLAKQHMLTFLQYIHDFDLPYEVVCLTGSVKGKERKEVLERMQSNEPVFVTGTHALFQEGVEFERLGLVVTDEQHRFGVKQRKEFSEKGNCHTLVMSATPIPRTLAMILYGNMNLSVIKELPANRQPILKCAVKENKRDMAFAKIAQEIHAGHQAYIICPLVEASEKTDAQSVMEYRSLLTEAFLDQFRIGILHGRMKAEEKNKIMTEFAEGRIDILVSTTVIEVGINVPNATVILIENANHFGLAQLHQLRGRVGRGKDQSYCIFLDASEGPEINERLKVVAGSNDGFYIANEDLKMRGPGDFYGIRQSGDLDFMMADIYQDADVLKEAAEDVQNILAADKDLSSEENRSLLDYLNATEDGIYRNL